MEVYRPAIARLALLMPPGGDSVQAYCDVLETKWLRSEKARLDIGLAAAIEAYLADGIGELEAGDTAGASG